MTAILRVQRAAGQPIAKKRKTYQRVDDALHTTVVRYDAGDVSSYVSDIARVLNINVT